MSDQAFFGSFNGIYFLQSASFITAICDRSHRKESVPFQETLADCAVPCREASGIYFGNLALAPDPLAIETTDSAGKPRYHVNLAGNAFETLGNVLDKTPFGFGRSLEYRPLAPEVKHTRVLLTVTLPPHTRYSVRMSPRLRIGNVFVLEQGIEVTILSALSVRYSDTTLAVETTLESGVITFLINSVVSGPPVQSTLLLVGRDSERQALRLRAILGSGFVASFVEDTLDSIPPLVFREIVRDAEYRVVLAIGLDSRHPNLLILREDPVEIRSVPREGGDLSFAVRDLVQAAPSLIVWAPFSENSCGPALYFAVKHRAKLEFTSDLIRTIELRDETGITLQILDLDSVSGVILNNVSKCEEASPSRSVAEVVLCENSLDCLLISNAVGFSLVRGAPIIFVPRFADCNVTGNAAYVADLLRKSTEAAIPPDIRNCTAKLIVAFTRVLPVMDPIFWTRKWPFLR